MRRATWPRSSTQTVERYALREIPLSWIVVPDGYNPRGYTLRFADFAHGDHGVPCSGEVVDLLDDILIEQLS